MKRLLMLCALAGLVVACSDDDDPDNTTTDGGTDSGASDSGAGDSGGPVVIKVANAGAACTVATAATACGGASSSCASATWAGVAYPENHCEATCTKAAECGTGGSCPLGEALANSVIGPMLSPAIKTTTGVCYKTCSAATDCRAGYSCRTTVETLGDPRLAAGIALVPSLGAKICVPAAGLVPSQADGGVGDGGVANRPDGGVDAGGIDAGG